MYINRVNLGMLNELFDKNISGPEWICGAHK